MHVAVAIVGFRNAGDIVTCLSHLETSTYTDFEVMVCENGGSEAFDALVQALPARLAGGQAVTVFAASGNLGFAGGVNACIARTPEAGGWWILNPDTEPAPEALSAMVEKLSDQSCDATGCVLRLPNGTNQAYGGRWSPWWGLAVSLGWGTPWSTAVDAADIERRQNYLLGASILASRRFVEVAGLLREDYFLYCEEIEWCARATAKGLRLGFAPEAVVLHRGGTTTGSSNWSRLAIYLGERNKLLLIRDRFPQCLPVAAVTVPFVLLLRCLRRRAWRPLGAGLGGWIDGLLNRRGPPGWLTP